MITVAPTHYTIRIDQDTVLNLTVEKTEELVAACMAALAMQPDGDADDAIFAAGLPQKAAPCTEGGAGQPVRLDLAPAPPLSQPIVPSDPPTLTIPTEGA